MADKGFITDQASIADCCGIYELTPTVYRARQELFRTNRLKAFNEALLSDPTENVKRSTCQSLVDQLSRQSRLSIKSVAFLNCIYMDKAIKHLTALLKV